MTGVSMPHQQLDHNNSRHRQLDLRRLGNDGRMDDGSTIDLVQNFVEHIHMDDDEWTEETVYDDDDNDNHGSPLMTDPRRANTNQSFDNESLIESYDGQEERNEEYESLANNRNSDLLLQTYVDPFHVNDSDSESEEDDEEGLYAVIQVEAENETMDGLTDDESFTELNRRSHTEEASSHIITQAKSVSMKTIANETYRNHGQYVEMAQRDGVVLFSGQFEDFTARDDVLITDCSHDDDSSVEQKQGQPSTKPGRDKRHSQVVCYQDEYEGVSGAKQGIVLCSGQYEDTVDTGSMKGRNRFLNLRKVDEAQTELSLKQENMEEDIISQSDSYQSDLDDEDQVHDETTMSPMIQTGTCTPETLNVEKGLAVTQAMRIEELHNDNLSLGGKGGTPGAQIMSTANTDHGCGDSSCQDTEGSNMSSGIIVHDDDDEEGFSCFPKKRAEQDCNPVSDPELNGVSMDVSIIDVTEREGQEYETTDIVVEPRKRLRFAQTLAVDTQYSLHETSTPCGMEDEERDSHQQEEGTKQLWKSQPITSLDEGSFYQPIQLEQLGLPGEEQVIEKESSSLPAMLDTKCNNPVTDLENRQDKGSSKEIVPRGKFLESCMEAFGYYLDRRQVNHEMALGQQPYQMTRLDDRMEPPYDMHNELSMIPWTREKDVTGEAQFLRQDLGHLPNSLLGDFAHDCSEIGLPLKRSISDKSDNETSLYTDPRNEIEDEDEEDGVIPIRETDASDRLGTSLLVPLGMDDADGTRDPIDLSVIAESLGMEGVEDALDNVSTRTEEKSRKSVSWNEFAQVQSDDPVLSGPLRLQDGSSPRPRLRKKSERINKRTYICGILYGAPFITQVLIYISITMLCIALGILFTALLGQNDSDQHNDSTRMPWIRFTSPPLLPISPTQAPTTFPDLIPPHNVTEDASPTSSPVVVLDTSNPTLVMGTPSPTPEAMLSSRRPFSTPSPSWMDPTLSPTVVTVVSTMSPTASPFIPTPAPVRPRPPFLWGG